MRVGFVLRSAEIKPLFYDLFIESILCISSHLCVYIYVFFGIERRDVFLSHTRITPPALPSPPPFLIPPMTPRLALTKVGTSVMCVGVPTCAPCERVFPWERPLASTHTALQHHARDDGSLDWVRLPACNEYGHTT